jgi:hypothetical protein
LFDIAGKQALPDLMGYSHYYIGASIVDNDIALPMQTFLSNADFFDGLVIPFWIGDGNDHSDLIEKLIYRPRIIPGSGFTDVSFFNMKTVDGQVDTWLTAVSAQIDVLRSAGERAEAVMKAFAAAYPDRLGRTVLRNGDWAVEMDGEQYYYAQGKFLKESELEQAADFRPQMLYRYTTEFARFNNAWEAVAAELFWRRTVFTDTADSGLTYNRSDPEATRSSFYEKLLHCETRGEAFEHQKIITFLGTAVTAHERLVTPLARVEQRINEIEKDNEEITDWKKSLDSISAWNWRNVSGSSRRSFHAYGTAIDLLMKLQRGKETYWLWTRDKGLDWRTIPEEDKLTPPRSVIRIFEEEGFIWGGKWPWYDTMHFEYHPELILLSLSPTLH